MKKPQITMFELIMLGVGSALVFPYTFMPLLTEPPANQDAWIVLLLAMFYIFIINAPLIYLVNQCRGLNANQISETIFGTVIGKIMIIPTALFCLYCFTACMAITTRFLNIYLFPNTPSWMLFLYVSVPACYSALKGAGVIGRLASFIVPFAIFSIIVFFLLGLEKMDLSQLQPILADSTFAQLNKGAFLTAARYSEVLIFFVFSGYLKQKYSVNKTYIASVITFGVCFLIMVLPVLTVLGAQFAKISFNPYYTFTRQVQAFGFLERVQSLDLLAWVPMTILKLCTYLYMASEIVSGIFKAKSHKKFVVPIAVIGFVVASLPVMDIYTTLHNLRSDQVMPFVVLPVTLVIPVIFVVIYLIRKGKIKPIIQKMQIAKSSEK